MNFKENSVMDKVVCFTTYSDPLTLVPVGNKAIAMLCNNVVCLMNIKTKKFDYYIANGCNRGWGISRLAGHEYAPIFGYAEAIINPRIFIIQYPELTTLTIFDSNDAVNYVDLCFNAQGVLVGISDYPKYTLYVWNVGAEKFYCKINTNVRSLPYGLLVSKHNLVKIVRRSVWPSTIFIWQLGATKNTFFLSKIMELELSDDFASSIYFSMCFTADLKLYIANDYGVVFRVETERYYLKTEWTPDGDDFPNEDGQYSLTNVKDGLLLSDIQHVIFLKKNGLQWELGWKLDNIKIPILRTLFTAYFEHPIVATDFGNLYSLEIETMDEVVTPSLVELYNDNWNVINFVFIRSITENAILLATAMDLLMLMNCENMYIYSSVKIENYRCMNAHNYLPMIAVGTALGAVHFISYENVQNPISLHIIQLRIEISAIYLLSHVAIIQDCALNFHIVKCNFKDIEFSIMVSITKDYNDNIFIMNVYLMDKFSAVLFVNEKENANTNTDIESDTGNNYAKAAWVYQWPKEEIVRKTKFELPEEYRQIECGSFANNRYEFYGLRKRDVVIDVILIKSNELHITKSIQTRHLAPIIGLSYTQNCLITWSIVDTILHYVAKNLMKAQVLDIDSNIRFLQKQITYNTETSSFLVNFHIDGYITIFKLQSSLPKIITNSLSNYSRKMYVESSYKIQPIIQKDPTNENEIKTLELKLRGEIQQQLDIISKQLTEVIDYEISIKGNTNVYLVKYCLNSTWHKMLKEQTSILFDIEKKSILDAISDQLRIRDWIFKLISSTTLEIGINIRAILSNSCVASYPQVNLLDGYKKNADYYLFYDMERIDNEYEDEFDNIAGENVSVAAIQKKRNRFSIQGCVYDHIMSKEYQMQDMNLVTLNQVCNEYAKYKSIIYNALISEFNKKFVELHDFKNEIMTNIIGANSILANIYSNMNIMCNLLNINSFDHPPLMVPEKKFDEILEKIMEVDESEVQALNHHKQQKMIALKKSARILLWPSDFWLRSLMTMMDGVIEKLWEEEIKKSIPPPAFLSKKAIHEYTFDDSKLLEEYERKIDFLKSERERYLTILKGRQDSTISMKNNLLFKLNKRCAEMVILKLRYDFAIRQYHLRLLNMRYAHIYRTTFTDKITALRDKHWNAAEKVPECEMLSEYWQESTDNIKSVIDGYQIKIQAIDKQFAYFLTQIQLSLTKDMTKLYKYRPKMLQKYFNNALVCLEVAKLIVGKPQKLPLAQEALQYCKEIDALDDVKNCPHLLDTRLWDPFVKMRRQRIELELKMKGINFRYLDSQNFLITLKNILVYFDKLRVETQMFYFQSKVMHFDYIKNQRLHFNLCLGQVEVGLEGTLDGLDKCILLCMDDIDNVNALIKEEGAKKLKAMQKVAFFRRQVMFREWEHRVYSANIDYLKHLLEVIQKCRVSIEFLNMLRNWKKNKDIGMKLKTTDVIETVIVERVEMYRMRLRVISKNIEIVKNKITNTKREGKKMNRQIQSLKVNVAYATEHCDFMLHEQHKNEQNERMAKIIKHHKLVDTVRNDYAHILELSTILELQRLRTYPTLAPFDCIEFN